MLWDYDKKNLLWSFDLIQPKKGIISSKILFSQNVLSTSHLTILFLNIPSDAIGTLPWKDEELHQSKSPAELCSMVLPSVNKWITQKRN